MCDRYVIGYSLSERKRKKLNWNEFHKVCELEGFTLKMIDVNSSIESQGPLHVFIHKMIDTVAHAEDGDSNAKTIVSRFKEYFEQHPELVVIDPFDHIKYLSNRYISYEIIQHGIQHKDIFTPAFVEIKSKNVSENISLLKRHGVSFPFVCKPLIAHGSSDAHKMMIIFNEEGLKDCQPPCVAQAFINHNAIVYKIFILGEHFHVIERPSFKNFYEEDCAASSTIFFHSHDISKSGSKSKWTILSEADIPLTVKPRYEVFEVIAKRIRELFGLVLIGVDVIIQNHTEKYAILDINVFPSFEEYPNFFEQLLECIKKLLPKKTGSRQCSKECTLKKCLSDDLDSGFESDEKRKCSTKQCK